MKLNPMLIVLLCWSTTVVGQITFGPEQLITDQSNSAGMIRSAVADIDNDGDKDLLVATFLDNKVAWKENLGDGIFGPYKTIWSVEENHAPSGVLASDIDGDGDLDVIFWTHTRTGLVWLENLGNGLFDSDIQLIKDSQVYVVIPKDVDGDGDIDILFRDSYVLAWLENDGTGNFNDQHEFVTGDFFISSSVLMDFDRDSDLDLVCMAYDGADHLIWFENTGAGTFSMYEELQQYDERVSLLTASDVNSDQFSDLFIGINNQLKCLLYLNDFDDGLTIPDTIDYPGNGISIFTTSDLDSDGDEDIIIQNSDGDKLFNMRNDGNASFEEGTEISSDQVFGTKIIIDDINNDGKVDVVKYSTINDFVVWYPNLGNGMLAPSKVIAMNAAGIRNFEMADLDNDGDLDILAAGYETYNSFIVNDKLMWYENSTNGNFIPHIISNRDAAYLLFAPGDIDGDGDIDIVTGSIWSGLINWIENDGMGGFSQIHTLTDSSLIITFSILEIADLDGDSDLDLATTAVFSESIFLLENDGSASFTINEMPPDSSRKLSLEIVDLDGDELPDLVQLIYHPTYVNGIALVWQKNLGNGFYDASKIIDTSFLYGSILRSADVDLDGDSDLLIRSSDFARLSWLENDGFGVFEAPALLMESQEEFFDAEIGDVDQDGDQDLLPVPINGPVKLSLNNGSLEFDQEITLNESFHSEGEFWIGDLDGDGDLDIVTSSPYTDKLSWYENRLTVISSSTPEPQTETSVIAYPNPVNSVLTVQSDLLEPQQYHVFSVLGEVVLCGSIQTNDSKIDFSSLYPNVYFIRFGSETIRIVKTH